MESKIAEAIGLNFNPVAVVLSDDKPENALQFKPGRWGCVMFLFASAVKGKTATFDSNTWGCWGGGVGLGFGNVYEQFPGGVDCFTRFLSSGNKEWEKGKQVGKGVKQNAGEEFAEDFLEGERYLKDPEEVEQWIEELPIMDVKRSHVLFKPLSDIDTETDTPETVVLVVDPDQLSALVILANYGRPGMENVSIPQAAGCQQIGIIPFNEAKSDNIRAVVGLTDISARKNIRKQLGTEVLTFAIPWKMFQEMEAHVEGSFLERPSWLSLKKNEEE